MLLKTFGRRLLAATVLMLPLMQGCRTTENPPSTASQASEIKAAPVGSPETSLTPNFCAAIRGNGNYIFTHFAALARIIEHYGLIDAAAGGSSASLTIYAYESILLNPAITACGEGSCSDKAKAERVALLLKSLHGYIDFVGNTDEAMAFQQLLPVVEKLKASGAAELAATDVAGAADAVRKILTSRDIRDIVNQEVLAQLQNPSNPQFHVNEVIAGIQNIGTWSVSSDRVFFRPGVLDFKAIAQKLGRVGSFYAGYGPADNDGMAQFLDRCSASAVGKTWQEIAGSPQQPTACGKMYFDLAKKWRTEFLADESRWKNRINDPVGNTLPALVSTSVLDGERPMKAWREAMTRYQAGQEPNLQLNFEDVKFGYWGRTADLARVAMNEQGFRDAKTAKFIALGSKPWREALSFSPAEPGLARILEIGPNQASAGGWPDLAPTLVLRNLGCRNIIYVTRQGEESDFTKQLARQLDMTPDQEKSLFSVEALPANSPSRWSGFKTSLRAADAIWCTNWNSFTNTQIVEMARESYSPVMVSRSPWFRDAANPWTRISESGPLGCR
jgi:hypothetical protein